MTYWYRMNIIEHGQKGAYIMDDEGTRVSPKFEYVYLLWKWIDTPECPYTFDSKNEDGTIVPFRMKLKQT